jgi:hypothetical protein
MSFTIFSLRPLDNDVSPHAQRRKEEIRVEKEKTEQAKGKHHNNGSILYFVFLFLTVLMMQALSFHAQCAHGTAYHLRRNGNSYGDFAVTMAVHHSQGGIKLHVLHN